MGWRTRQRGQPYRTAMVLVVSAGSALAMAAAGSAAHASAGSAGRAAALPAAPCTALTGLHLPNLPGPDTATVTATEVTGSGCQVGIEITDTSDPRGGQPGAIGIDLTLPDSWNGSLPMRPTSSTGGTS